jgi:NADP-dependent aldehyde dehydrogenase
MFVGRDRPAGNGASYGVDPSNGSLLKPRYGEASDADIDRAAELAYSALDPYRATSLSARATFLEHIAEGLNALSDQLVERATAETGLPRAVLKAEVDRTTRQLRLFADVVVKARWLELRIDPARPDRMPPRPDIRLRRIPVGPVAIFGASNFPVAFSVAGGDTAAALAAGAPVVVKGHETHPGTDELVGAVIRRAVEASRLPEGVFALLFGTGPKLGQALVTHRRIKAVAFTGSHAAGRAIMDAAARRTDPIPVFAEMSSTNPVIVLDGAVRDRASTIGRELVASMSMRTGQMCTSPGLVLVPSGDSADALVNAAACALPDLPANPMLSLGIARTFADRVERAIQCDGVEVVARVAGDRDIAASAAPALLRTTADCALAAPSLLEEMFGPVAIVVEVRDQSELRQLLEQLDGQLTVSVHAADDDLAAVRVLLPVLERIAGRILFNDWPTGVEVGHSMVHGGPYPAASDARATSVGTLAIDRFLRPVAYQSFPEGILPDGLGSSNPERWPRLIDGEPERHD